MNYAAIYGPSMAKSGRPPVPSDERQTITRSVGFTDSEYRSVKAKADAMGTKFVTFLRNAALGDALATQTPKGSQWRGVALIGTIHAGEPAECREEDQREIVCSEHPNGDAYRYLEINGDCMDKQVPDGALALFREQGHTFGQTVAVLIDCELMLRVYEYDPKFKCIRLDPDSLNPAHKPYLILEEDPKSEKHIWIRPENALVRGVFTGDYIMRRKGK